MSWLLTNSQERNRRTATWEPANTPYKMDVVWTEKTLFHCITVQLLTRVVGLVRYMSNHPHTSSTLLGTHQVPYQLTLLHTLPMTDFWHKKNHSQIVLAKKKFKILLTFVEINSWKSDSFGLLLQIHKYKMCFACLFFKFWKFGKLNLKLSNLYFFFSFF